jgi:hypothetical protein
MSEVLICKYCRSTWRGDRVRDFKCPECKNQLMPLQVSLGAWNNYNRAQKEKIKESFFQDDQKNAISLNSNFMMESYLSSINKNIQTIKNIIVFFTVLWGISVFIAILTFGSFARLMNNMLR